jgi:hypothetical protein
MTYYATPTKRAQDSFLSCQCLLSSLTLDFLKLITADSTKYHLPALNAADGPVPSGPLLLKLIISKAHIDSRATISYIRDSLTKLDAKMVELDSNVAAFNLYVQTQVKNLSARGETSNDFLVNLFKGYKAANDVLEKSTRPEPVVGKLNFLEKSTRPEIANAVHQCARFASNPRQSHANAVKYLCR